MVDRLKRGVDIGSVRSKLPNRVGLTDGWMTMELACDILLHWQGRIDRYVRLSLSFCWSECQGISRS